MTTLPSLRAASARVSPLILTLALGACASGSTTSTPAPAGGSDDAEPRIVQPGAPGEGVRMYSPEELDEVEGVSYSEADVHFMQGMIPHHAQALVMTDLVRQHATTDAVRQMALRMEISQADEIALMESWLRDHNEPVRMGGMGSGTHMMPGMLTPDQMEELRNARGVRFDQLFLEYMIQHHQGAITMVDELFGTSGAGQESTIFKFAEDVGADQMMEIERMQGLLTRLR